MSGGIADGVTVAGADAGVLPYVYRVTKYDPADRDEQGNYVGVEDIRSDHGLVEAIYLDVVAAFAEDSGVSTVTIREPAVIGSAHFGVEPPIDGYGLAGLFPADLRGYHDGAEIPLAIAVELVRAMLRDNGAWCRLEVEDRFCVHVGYDQYLYVGSVLPCRRAVDLAHALGLFAERITRSPYDHSLDDEPSAAPRAADPAFWAQARSLITECGAVLLEEGYLQNSSRWHRLTLDNLDTVRAGLTNRSRLLIWPDLRPDVPAVLAALPGEGLSVVVWQRPDGIVTSRTVDETQYPELTAGLTGATAATILSGYADRSRPLAAAVLPDDDGVLRARWTA